jgi:ABC-type lipoprotein export system ATPase subunit
LELLRSIATKQEAAILMATHSLEAASVADTIVKMRDGGIYDVVNA